MTNELHCPFNEMYIEHIVGHQNSAKTINCPFFSVLTFTSTGELLHQYWGDTGELSAGLKITTSTGYF